MPSGVIYFDAATRGRRYRVQRGKLFQLGCALLACGVLAVPAHAQEFAGEGVPDVQMVPPVVEVRGAPENFLVPRESCLADLDCVQGTEVYYAGAAPDLEGVPDVSIYGLGDAAYGYCGTSTGTPERNYNHETGNFLVFAASAQECPSSVPYHEVTGTLQRLQSGQWYNLDTVRDTGGGSNTTDIVVSGWDCNHQNEYVYRNESVYYHEVRSNGLKKGYTYVGRARRRYSCPDVRF